MNPSPPFLGFVAASSGQEVMDEQIEHQRVNFRPPHPAESMISEAELRNEVTVDEVVVNGTARDLLVAETT